VCRATILQKSCNLLILLYIIPRRRALLFNDINRLQSHFILYTRSTIIFPHFVRYYQSCFATLYFYHMFAIAHYHALPACQAMGGIWVMLFSTQKRYACIFFASRYSWPHERILLTQADSLRLLHRRWSRRNIVSLQSNKITIRKNPMKSTGSAMQKSAADGYAWATAPLPVTCTWVRHKIGDFNLYTSGGGCTAAAPYVSF